MQSNAEQIQSFGNVVNARHKIVHREREREEFSSATAVQERREKESGAQHSTAQHKGVHLVTPGHRWRRRRAGRDTTASGGTCTRGFGEFLKKKDCLCKESKQNAHNKHASALPTPSTFFLCVRHPVRGDRSFSLLRRQGQLGISRQKMASESSTSKGEPGKGCPDPAASSSSPSSFSADSFAQKTMRTASAAIGASNGLPSSKRGDWDFYTSFPDFRQVRTEGGGRCSRTLF